MTDPLPRFEAPYAPDDAALAEALLAQAPLPPAAEAAVDALALDLIGAIREGAGHGAVEALLREYALTTREGLALMSLAEALLRVPDAGTSDRLIADKLREGDFAHHEIRSETGLAHAAAWALGLGARLVAPEDSPEATLSGMVRRLGRPAVRNAAQRAMRLMGGQFVLAEEIGAALKRAASGERRRYRYSYDMLGEGARTAQDAAHYRAAYAEAIARIGAEAGNGRLPDRPGISVKLSALHPRFTPLQAPRVMAELVPVLRDLARAARAHDLNVTVDAEEAERLELSLDVFGAVLADPALAGWDGFGLAVQAYSKRCLPVIDHVAHLAERFDRRLMVRLVKGAYWDSEIKLAQMQGLADYPVFSRKPMTDLSYLAAARRLLARRDRLYPQFATHNALTIATILGLAGQLDGPGDGGAGFEFQRLHGMGEALYARLLERKPSLACRVYAPVGGHRELLAYLVRRLLENGANSSFVARATDRAVPARTLLARPQALIETPSRARHPRIPLPRDLFGETRRNSSGLAFGDGAALRHCLAERDAAAGPGHAAPILDGRAREGVERSVSSPIDGASLGPVIEATAAIAAEAMGFAAAGFPAWAARPAGERAACLDRAAEALEASRGRFLHLLQAEAGKTLDDALAEWREAIDFLRYYAAEGRRLFGAPVPLPGPAGESNALSLRGRGVFVAISPWNFPLAIFLGQISAALMAGDTVVAKPAPQTPLVAAEAVRLLHAAGIPGSALQLVPGGPEVGAALLRHPALAGVVFTGSTATAKAIDRALAARDGAILPLIAETGGINAMIVDATALPEQVADDVVASAFRSAGQRCSALRLLLVQADVADRMIAAIAGAAWELKVGDPRDLASDLGPVIDAAAKARLVAHVARMRASAKTHLADAGPAEGLFVPPQIFELARVEDLTEEVFGPILHVVRYRPEAVEPVLAAVAASGYGLTLGVQSRIDAFATRVAAALPHGNVYVNRNMIGAVVGSQPFGGTGLSGTGPKAGGPHYLARFATERTLTVNTAAAGGSVGLITLDG
ncbi:bifunctional proline dehydrogenase/L-glutamate gamma-semialdehyde dehydrogenase PutA [Methylobacterium organophilum]|uniref:bifunctional proline dehydrogenase/L-glutamate gamma-semialdehyde dehydrogenase PutA n=1 Tax=Methylobacterium organophilum TaxID=410 RepID=UPI001F135C5A|nr:bifunctional proline dehydrogenase/L-glutamate gamma-semialdehyde dehydrogenase PutA [Methylobacterium organophilum]UMY19221.1 bifunctional proline dehydrogenase/L-glutamate gamma-semialdehyde dehydrogenase PutA [Methylobacterium organophilum]